ncbi:MAG: ABC transporter substrate-binding protein [Christensenellales bacterium]
MMLEKTVDVYNKGLPDVIQIGCMLPLTGDNAYFGSRRKQALELAVKEINDSGGIIGKTVVLDIQDDYQRSAERAIELAEQFKSCHAIIGAASTQAMAINEVTKQNKQIVLSPAELSYEDTQNPYMFFIQLSSVSEIEAPLKFLVKEGCKKICVLYFDVEIRDITVQYLQSNNIDYIEDAFEMNYEVDFSSQITRCTESGCDGIYIAGLPVAYHSLAEQMAARGYSPIVTALGLYNADCLELVDANLLKGWYTCGEWAEDVQNETVQRIIRSFHDAGEEEITGDMITYYGSMYVLRDAIERCNSFNPDAVSQALTETKDFNAGFLYTCDEQHRMVHRVFVMQLDGDKQLHTVDIIEY